MNDIHSLSHTKWNCKYHIVFALKYRRKVFYADKRLEKGAISKRAIQMEGSKYNRGRSMPRSSTYAFRDTAKNEYIRFHVISQRKK